MGEDQIETMFHKEHETYASVIKIMGIEKSN
jgi:hypothetical protein